MHYSDYFNGEALVLAGLYCFAFVMVFWRLLPEPKYQLQDRIFFSVTFVAFTAFSFIVSYVDILPFFPDTLGFAGLVESNTHTSLSLGVRLYLIISTPLRLLALNQLEVYLVFQCAFYFAAIILLWRGWCLHCQNNDIAAGNFQVLVLLGVIYPAALAFITIPLREFIQIFGFALFLYGLSQYVYKGKLIWLFVGALLTIFVRPQLVIIYPFMVLIAKQYSFTKLCVYGVLALPVAILLFETVTGYQFSPAFFSYLRNAANENYGETGMTYGLVNWSTYLDILLDLPLLVLQFILSPLPILHKVSPLSLKFLLADLVYVVFILFGAFSIKVKHSQNYIKMFFCLIAIFSIWEFYIGGAVRHRFPLIMMLLPLAGLYYSTLITSLVNSRRSQ